MKKLFLLFFTVTILFSLNTGIANASLCAVEHPDTSSNVVPRPNAPAHAELADSIVPCGQYADCRCEFTDFFHMIRKIYIFITWTIALPLAGLLIVLGGVLMVLSGANPGLYEKGKTLLWGAVWGAILIFGAWLIIKVIFMALGPTTDPGLISF